MPIWLKGNFRTVLGGQWLPDHFWKWIEIFKFLYLQNEQIMLAPLLLLLGFKGTVSRDFWPFFLLKDSTWAPYEQAKIVSWTFSFLRRYSRKICVRLVNDYAETGVSVVNNYADTRFSNFAIWISPRKRKILRYRFWLFIWGPRQIFWAKKMVENLVTLFLSDLKNSPKRPFLPTVTFAGCCQMAG